MQLQLHHLVLISAPVLSPSPKNLDSINASNGIKSFFNFTPVLAGSVGVARRARISNVGVKNITSAGQAGFNHRAVVSTGTKHQRFSAYPISCLGTLLCTIKFVISRSGYDSGLCVQFTVYAMPRGPCVSLILEVENSFLILRHFEVTCLPCSAISYRHVVFF